MKLFQALCILTVGVLVFGASRVAHAQAPNCYAPAGSYCQYLENGETPTQGYTFAAYSTGGFALYGSDSSYGAGVTAISDSGDALDATSTTGNGIVASGYGTGITASAGFTGVSGSGITGVEGSGTSMGVLGESGTSSFPSVNAGVVGSGSGSSTTLGGYFSADSADGVFGNSNSTSGNKAGVKGTSSEDTGYGVAGVNSGSGMGVYGKTSGTGSTSYALYGIANAGSSFGVYGDGNSTTAGTGVSGHGGTGVSGFGGVYGVYGSSTSVAVYADGNLDYTGSFNHVSDERLKKNIQPLTGSVDKLLQLRGVSFEWRDPSRHGGVASVRRGFIAQEFEKVFPEWVTAGSDGFKMIDDSGVIAVAVEAIRTLKGQLDTANAKNDALEDRVRTLENGGHSVTGGNGFNFSGNNLGLLGLAAAIAYASSRRKKSEQAS